MSFNKRSLLTHNHVNHVQNHQLSKKQNFFFEVQKVNIRSQRSFDPPAFPTALLHGLWQFLHLCLARNETNQPTSQPTNQPTNQSNLTDLSNLTISTAMKYRNSISGFSETSELHATLRQRAARKRQAPRETASNQPLASL